jgi:hypothetical protein
MIDNLCVACRRTAHTDGEREPCIVCGNPGGGKHELALALRFCAQVSIHATSTISTCDLYCTGKCEWDAAQGRA